MGYYATGNGAATIKKGITEEFIKQLIRDNVDKQPTEMIVGVTDGEILFEESDSHWDEDDTMHYLDIFSPYIQEGEMEYFSHEDGHSWKYIYAPDDEWWSGEEVSELSNFEDDELIAELENRGYKVTKKKAR